MANRGKRSRAAAILTVAVLIGIGLVYGLAMLDAYVSAHLLDFDVGENLSFRADPLAGGFRLSARIHLGSPDGRGLPYR